MSAATASPNAPPCWSWEISSDPDHRHKTANTPGARASRTGAMVASTAPLPLAASSPKAVRSRIATPAVPLPPSPPSSSHPPLQGPHQDRLSTSPTYFALAVDTTHDPADSFQAPYDRRRTATPGSVLSVAANSPKLVRRDSRSGFEAFRKRSDQSTATLAHASLSPSTGIRLEMGGDKESRSPPAGQSRHGDPMDLDPSPANSGPPRGRSDHDSPATAAGPSQPSRSHLLHGDDRHARLSVPPTSSAARVDQPSSARAMTLPARVDRDGPAFVAPVDVAALLAGADAPLILDVRVQQQFARSRVVGALNLCIPTTLLKRPSYNLEKLAATFTDPAVRARFERWRTSSCIVVYDERSSVEKEAASCLSTLKKFSNEGWQGRACILKGGFDAFSKQFPDLVDGRGSPDSTSPSSPSSSRGPSLKASGPATAPLAGGLAMPSAQSGANPFFGNIRQNMDLVGGVGQMPIRRPSKSSREREATLPRWLSVAADERDQGKLVADHFLRIEKAEQRRMQDALSGAVSYGSPTTAGHTGGVRIAGIEQGAKNRYNNIWPYDHARVKLEGRAEGDYINASHVKAAWSNKRYIATQGPMPATFEDFWHLVWEQDVRVIVMLTAEHEGGQLKCHPYWTGREFGPLRLKPVSERKVSLEPSRSGRPGSGGRRRSGASIGDESLSPSSTTADPVHAVVRTFSLTHTAHPFMPIREITQLQLDSWLDFDAPAHPAHVLNLIEQCDAVARAPMSPQPHPQEQPFPPRQRPVLVHCSAGCGRTGTFCTIDSVIDMLRRQRAERLRRGKTVVSSSSSSSSSSKHGGHEIDPAPPPLETDTGTGSVAGDDLVLKNSSDWLYRDDIDLIAMTVEQLRGQRISMVQCLRQYVLCYETVLEWLINCAPPMPPPPRPRLAPVGSSSTSTASSDSSISKDSPAVSSPPSSSASSMNLREGLYRP